MQDVIFLTLEFSHNDPVSVISSNMGEKHTGVCTACKQDFQGQKICCKSCGNVSAKLMCKV